MVAEKDDDRVLPELKAVEGGEHAADLGVHVGGAGVVGAEEFAALAVGELAEGLAEFAEADGEGRGGSLVAGRAVQGERAFRIQVKILLGRDEGIVRLHETGADDPRAVAEAFDLGADGTGDLAVGLVVVAAVHGGPVAPGEFPLGEIAAGEFFSTERRRFEGLRGVPGAGQVHPLGAEGRIATAAEVKDFPEGGGVAPVLLEELGQRDDRGQTIAEHRTVVGDAGLVGAESGEERTAAGIADGVLHVGAVETDGPRGEAIDVRGLDGGVAVTAEGVAQIVDGDEEDVEFFRRGGAGCAGDQRSEQSAEQERKGRFHGWVAAGTGKGRSEVAGCSPRRTLPARPVSRR